MSFTSWPLWITIAFVCIFGLFYWIDRINVKFQKKLNLVSDRLQEFYTFQKDIEEKDNDLGSFNKEAWLSQWKEQNYPFTDDDRKYLIDGYSDAFGQYLRGKPIDISRYIDEDNPKDVVRTFQGDLQLSYSYYKFLRTRCIFFEKQAELFERRLTFYSYMMRGHSNLGHLAEWQKDIDDLVFDLWELKQDERNERANINELLKEKGHSERFS